MHPSTYERDRVAGRRIGLAIIATCVVMLAGPANAASKPKQFLAIINGPQETPPNGSPAQGVAHLTFDGTTKMLCYSISFQGLPSAEILAHIHGPALPGTAAGILFPLPLGGAKSGCAGPLTSDQSSDLLKNLLYINVHSVGFPGGEIRGQILRIK
jgi:hypothetical protein